MYSMLETLIVLAVFPTIGAGIAIWVAKEAWIISGWVTVGVGIGGWILGFIVGALVSTAIHTLFKGRE